MHIFVRIFILLSLLSLISSCKNEKNARVSKSNILIEKRDSLIYQQKSNKPYTGIVIDTLNGKILEYNVKNGLKDGPFKISGLNGKIEMAGNMVNDRNEGEWKYYYPDGQLESAGGFKNDTPSGKWIFYYPSGVKKEEGNYFKGLRDGKWIGYDTTGKAVNYTHFEKGDSVK